MKKSKNCIGLTLIDEQSSVKYLTLTLSLMGNILQESRNSLGALGTHYTEHFFAKLRRISYDDSRTDTFLWALVSDLLFEELSYENNINVSSPKRASSSGATLSPDPNFYFRPLNISMNEVLNFYIINTDFSNYINLFRNVKITEKNYDFWEQKFFLKNFPNA